MTQPKCPVCNQTEPWHNEPPPAPKPARLTLHVCKRYADQELAVEVRCDNYGLDKFFGADAEAAAQTYIDELIEHFRNGGR